MMRVYHVCPGDNFTASVRCSKDDVHWEYDKHTAKGLGLASIWRIEQCTVDDDGGKYPLGHFGASHVGSSYVIVHPHAMAIEAIASFLRAEGELLPTLVADHTSYVFNPLNFVHALDEKRTEFDALDLRQGIRTVYYPIFQAKALEGVHFFRILENWTGIYLAEPPGGGFKALYDSLGLTGLRFVEKEVTHD